MYVYVSVYALCVRVCYQREFVLGWGLQGNAVALPLVTPVGIPATHPELQLAPWWHSPLSPVTLKQHRDMTLWAMMIKRVLPALLKMPSRAVITPTLNQRGPDPTGMPTAARGVRQ